MPADRKTIVVAHYIEELARQILGALPYYADSKKKIRGLVSKKNGFPNAPGVYVILRRVNLPNVDYRTRGVNTKEPLVLYVGKTTTKRSIARRLDDHFGGSILSYQGSQFRRFLYQICQDENTVKRILWSSNTLIACVPVREGDAVIDAVEQLAMQVFRPRFNIKDRY